MACAVGAKGHGNPGLQETRRLGYAFAAVAERAVYHLNPPILHNLNLGFGQHDTVGRNKLRR